MSKFLFVKFFSRILVFHYEILNFDNCFTSIKFCISKYAKEHGIFEFIILSYSKQNTFLGKYIFQNLCFIKHSFLIKGETISICPFICMFSS